MSKGPDSWTYPDLPGVVQRKDNGKASSRWFYQGKYHRRTHPIPWDRKNKGLIRPLHRQFVAEIVGGQYKGNGKRTIERLETAKREYFRSQSKRLTAASRQEAEQAFAYYLDMDMPLKRDTLRHHILRRLDEPPPGRSALANETARKYLTRVRRFCRWCVESRHLDASPMEGIALPPQRRTRKSEQDIFSAEEVSAVVGWYRERAGRQGDWRFRMQNLEHAILIELVHLIGLRPSEALRARWEDVTPSGCSGSRPR